MDDQERRRKLNPVVWVGVALAAIAAIVALLLNRLRRPPAGPPPLKPQPLSADALLDLQGLTEEEAAARKLEGQDNTLVFNPPRSPREIWRASFFSLFTLSLSGLAIIQLLLGRYLDALVSLAVMALNTTINVVQETLARRRLKEIEEAARLQATVIREGKARSLDPSDVVRGDILVAGPGDQILVDGLVVGEGQILVDESMLTGQSQRQVKRAGDAVYAGSFCASGRAAYEAQLVGDERLIVTLTDKTQPAEEELTPLEKIVAAVMRFLLLFVGLYAILLVLTFFRLEGNIPVDVFNSAASVIFNIAPAGLFFMIVVTYASGTADLGRLGALVHRARSVESLALTNVLCFARDGVLTGTQVEVEPVDPPEGEEPLAESRLRQILGDYARASTTPGLVMRAMSTSFLGSSREVQEQQPFLSVQGWSGVAFDDEDLRGVYILGEPQVLEPHLAAAPKEAEEAEEEEQPPGWRRMFAPVGRLFRRSRPEEDQTSPKAAPAEAADQSSEGGTGPSSEVASAENPHDPPGSEAETYSADTPRSSALRQVTGRLRRLTHREEGDVSASLEQASSQAGEDGPRPPLLQRLTGPLRRLVRRQEAAPEEEDTPEEQALEERYLLFAYRPEFVPLHDAEGMPRLPGGLTPLCNLRYTEKVRPEAIETIQAFGEMGMGIKVFASGSPQQTAAILQQAGLGQETGTPFRTISGAELAELGPAGWAELTSGHTIFGDLTPEQAGQIVEAVRHEGQAVATVGDGVNDLPALLQSNLAIARQASSQAALSVADIVVLDESPKALLTVLDKGQRIVNGLLDVLKLYLTQVFYLSLLIAAVWLASDGFPYLSGQGTVIVMATVSLPSIGLTLWASAGILPSADLRWLLARFIGPAAVTMAIVGTVVYVRFLDLSGIMAYAQFGVTHVLVLMGLVLVVFTKPPWRSRSNGGVQEGDRRPTILALILLVVFLVVTRIPLAQELLQIGTLNQPEHYAFIVGIVFVWAIVLQLIWWIIPLAVKIQPTSYLTQ